MKEKNVKSNDPWFSNRWLACYLGW